MEQMLRNMTHVREKEREGDLKSAGQQMSCVLFFKSQVFLFIKFYLKKKVFQTTTKKNITIDFVTKLR